MFDLDGTVLDTIADIAAAVNRALAAFGYPERSVAEVQSFLGNGSLMLIKRALPADTADEHCIEIRARFRKEYEADMYSNTKPYEGIPQMLAELASHGAKIAVVTNKDHRNAVPMIKHYFGDSVQSVIGVSGDSDRKPNPENTFKVLAQLGVTAEEALFVGDGMADLRVSENSGIDFVPVGYGYTSPEILLAQSGKRVMEDVSSLRRELLGYFI